MNGFIYYPEFCRIVMRKLREDDDENFHQELFRNLVGPKSYPDGVPAALYNVNAEFLTKEQFKLIMLSLPEYVDAAEVDKMFQVNEDTTQFWPLCNYNYLYKRHAFRYNRCRYNRCSLY